MRVEQSGVSKASIQASMKQTKLQTNGIDVGYQTFLVSSNTPHNAVIPQSTPSLYATLAL